MRALTRIVFLLYHCLQNETPSKEIVESMVKTEKSTDYVLFMLRNAAVFAVCVGLTYWPTLGGWYYHSDDFDLLRRARDFWSIKHPMDFLWQSPDALFTPLSNLLFWTEFQLFHFNHTGYQIVSLLIHWINAILVAGLAYAVDKDKRLTMLAGILFAVAYPVQEPVSWVTGYVHLLAAVFYVGSLLCYVTWTDSNRVRYLVGSLALLFLGILTKEDIITAPALIVLLSFFAFRNKLAKKQVYLSVITFTLIGFLFFLVIILWHARVQDSTVKSGIYTIGLHALSNYRYLVGLLFPPPDYIPFVSFIERLLPSLSLDMYAIMVWSLLIPLTFWFAYNIIKGSPLQRLATLLILIAYAPFSITTVGISLRYLYIPYVGFAILLADLATRLLPRYQRLVIVALSLFVTANILTTWTWQIRMNQNSSVRADIVRALAIAYDGRDDSTTICVRNLPDKYQDVVGAVLLFTNRKPSPTIYLTENCPSDNALRFIFMGDRVISE